MKALLPLAYNKGVRIITNMGAADSISAAQCVEKVAKKMNLPIRVACIIEKSEKEAWTYLGVDCILDALKTGAHVILSGRVADPSLFLAPMIYHLGWSLDTTNQDNCQRLSQGTAAAHLLECGCHLTGGYFSHPHDRDLGLEQLCNLSLPFAEVWQDGKVYLAKQAGSGGELSVRTCAQQLLYEIHDPQNYITPDLVADFSQVRFSPRGSDVILMTGARGKDRPKQLLRLVSSIGRWKSWAEISYGGVDCIKRALQAEQLVRQWMERDHCLNSVRNVHCSIIGANSLYLDKQTKHANEVRLRFDGLFDTKEMACVLCEEVMALYTNGPAGGAGVTTGCKYEIGLHREFVDRQLVSWVVQSSCTQATMCVGETECKNDRKSITDLYTHTTTEYIPPEIGRAHV